LSTKENPEVEVECGEVSTPIEVVSGVDAAFAALANEEDSKVVSREINGKKFEFTIYRYGLVIDHGKAQELTQKRIETFKAKSNKLPILADAALAKPYFGRLKDAKEVGDKIEFYLTSETQVANATFIEKMVDGMDWQRAALMIATQGVLGSWLAAEVGTFNHYDILVDAKND